MAREPRDQVREEAKSPTHCPNDYILAPQSDRLKAKPPTARRALTRLICGARRSGFRENRMRLPQIETLRLALPMGEKGA